MSAGTPATEGRLAAVVVRIAAVISLLGVGVSALLTLFIPLASAGCGDDDGCQTVILVVWIGLALVTLAAAAAEITAIVIAGRRWRRAATLVACAAVGLIAAWIAAEVAVNRATDVA